jgi:multiple sugar transport system ATP-binding protein
MKDGRIQQIDTPAEIYNRPANVFVAGFLGAPGMNFIEGRLQGGRFVSEALSADVSGYLFDKAPQDGKPVVLGIRPEHIALDAAGGEAHGRGTVSLVEPMGAHWVTWLDLQGRPLAVQSVSNTEALLDRQVAFRIDAARVSLFDAESQRRL